MPSHPQGSCTQGYGGPFRRRRTRRLHGDLRLDARDPVEGDGRSAGLLRLLRRARRGGRFDAARGRTSSSPARRRSRSALAGAIAAWRHRVPLGPRRPRSLARGRRRAGRGYTRSRAPRGRGARTAALPRRRGRTTPTESFRATSRRGSPDPEKVAVVANGTTEELARGRRGRGPLAAGSGCRGTFVWTYCGNVGLSQDLGDGARGRGPARPRVRAADRRRRHDPQPARAAGGGAAAGDGQLRPGSSSRARRPSGCAAPTRCSSARASCRARRSRSRSSSTTTARSAGR